MGKEITFDYQFERFGGKKQKCFCGEPNCRGFLGAKPKKLLIHQRKVSRSCLKRRKLELTPKLQKEHATRVTVSKSRGKVANPLTVDMIYSAIMHSNPINRYHYNLAIPVLRMLLTSYARAQGSIRRALS